jgi:hypothetical protein
VDGKQKSFPASNRKIMASRMLEIAITLIVGLAIGYGVRKWRFAKTAHHNDGDVRSDRT